MADYHLLIQPGGGKDDPSACIGTGPYVLKDYEMGVRFVFEKNANHWDGAQGHAETIEMIVMSDDTARVAALQSGRTGIVESALSMAKSPDASLEVLQRVLEAALDLALGGSKFTRLREQLHLTSQVEESTLQSVWLRCKRARQELGSGLRDDLSLASLLLGVAGALRWQAVG